LTTTAIHIISIQFHNKSRRLDKLAGNGRKDCLQPYFTDSQ